MLHFVTIDAQLIRLQFLSEHLVFDKHSSTQPPSHSSGAVPFWEMPGIGIAPNPTGKYEHLFKCGASRD
jgi:hypothetical protein